MAHVPDELHRPHVWPGGFFMRGRTTRQAPLNHYVAEASVCSACIDQRLRARLDDER
jgi:hypothetical protein